MSGGLLNVLGGDGSIRRADGMSIFSGQSYVIMRSVCVLLLLELALLLLDPLLRMHNFC